MKNIDWRNHLVAFLSAVIGILIAFRLEDVREQWEETERLDSAYDLVIAEAGNNIQLYQKNVATIESWLEYFDVVAQLASGEVDHLAVSLDSYRLITEDSSRLYRLQGYSVSPMENASVRISRNVSFDQSGEHDVKFDVLPETGISTSAWNASLSSGIFTRLDPAKLNKLTELYGWIRNDFGRNEFEIFDYGIVNLDRDFDDIDELARFHKITLAVQRFKLERTKPLYEELKKLD